MSLLFELLGAAIGCLCHPEPHFVVLRDCSIVFH